MATTAIARHFRTAFPAVRRVAGYLATDGEPDVLPLLARLDRTGGRVFVPRLDRLDRTRMSLHAWSARTALPKNRFGIREPPARSPRARPWTLAVLLLPLVAFDAHGNRLGRGGGFYDRLLARPWPRRPLFIGVAHECQRCEHIPSATWDVPLDGVLTPAGFFPVSPPNPPTGGQD